jgi:hypothetical protein
VQFGGGLGGDVVRTIAVFHASSLSMVLSMRNLQHART